MIMIPRVTKLAMTIKCIWQHSMPDGLPGIFHLIMPSSKYNKYYYYPLFTGDKTTAYRG